TLESLLRLTKIPDEIIVFKKTEGGPIKRTFSMKRRLRQAHFEMAVLFQNAFEAAFTSWMAGIKLRAGYPTDLRGPFLNIKVPLIPSTLSGHQVFYYLEIVKYLDDYFRRGRFQYIGKPDCAIRIPSHEVNKARKFLVTEGVDLERRLVCLCPGSVNSDAKRWPAEYYSKLADLLVREDDTEIIFLGAPEERDLVSGIIADMKNGHAFNLAAKADIVQSLSIMNLSALVISNDTGSAHLAVAAGAKCLTIFGPTIPGATAPFGKQTFIIQGKAACAPCDNHNCHIDGHPCMRSLLPEVVSQKAIEILAFPPSF
ncbi:MAG: glycosyltransferase family 9 protein, partial [Desulfomonilaceae bacterium]